MARCFHWRLVCIMMIFISWEQVLMYNYNLFLQGLLENTEKDRIKRMSRLKPPTGSWVGHICLFSLVMLVSVLGLFSLSGCNLLPSSRPFLFTVGDAFISPKFCSSCTSNDPRTCVNLKILYLLMIKWAPWHSKDQCAVRCF